MGNPRRECELDYDKMQTTRHWFSKRNLGWFRDKIMPRYKGKPCVYVEVGVFEGCSLRWMLDYVLDHPDSFGVGIDTWLMTPKRSNADMEEVYQRARFNLAPYLGEGPRPKCQLVRAMSADALRMMCLRGSWNVRPGTVDVFMIDGQHTDLAALDDGRQAMKLVKPGGWILWDDVRNDREKDDDHVERGLRQWQEEFRGRIAPAWTSKYMECFERVS